jgi:hypothetical protein
LTRLAADPLRTKVPAPADPFAQPLPQQKIDIHELIKAELARFVLVYEDVDIGIGPRLIPRMRAKQIKRLASASANRGLDLFQSRDDFAAAHSSY